MFLTADALAMEFGIDERIARFYVDREPPKDNLYWKGKLLYLRPQPGYLFLPLITDLYFKSGVSLSALLNDAFVSTLEKIGDIAARQEFGLMSQQAAIGQCTALWSEHSPEFMILLQEYFSGKPGVIASLSTPFKALHRGDLFLFSLLELPADMQTKLELVKTWFALITTLLLLDDAADFVKDRETGDENALLESGFNQAGFEKIRQQLAINLDRIAAFNKTMAEALHRKFLVVAAQPDIKELLNA